MSRTLRPRPVKPSPNQKTAGAPVFDPAVFLATAAIGRDISKYSKKKIIFAQGDDADAVFYIKKGKVKVAVISDEGKEAIVALLGADEFVGEGCLIGQPKRLATASAMVECEIMRVEKTEIQRVIRDEPAFSQMFVSHILERNARVEEDLVDQLFNSTEKRLARLLLLLANFGKEGRPEPILAKISQETLAEMIGTTRSRVSHFMNKFRQLGFIDYNGHLEVHKRPSSRCLCHRRGVMLHLVQLDRSYDSETVAVMGAAFDKVSQSVSKEMNDNDDVKKTL